MAVTNPLFRHSYDAGPRNSAPSLDAKLDEILRAMDSASIKYCLLKGYDLLWHAGHKEIDLLVLPDQIPALTNLLRSRQFATLPAWGHSPHHFFVGYNESDGTWLKLDIVDAVRYGDPVRALEIDITPELLRNRRHCPHGYVLAPEDEFFKLLLHCVLHEGEFTAQETSRLLELARAIDGDSKAPERLAHFIDTFLAPALTSEMLARMVENGDFRPALAKRSAIFRHLFWTAPFGNAWRWLSTRILRASRPLLIAIHRRGMLVALLAPDGAGKTTLANQLAQDPFIKAQVIYMGSNEAAQTVGLDWILRLHRRFPAIAADEQGQRRPFLLRVINYALALTSHFHRINLALYHKLRGRFVVFDRYIYDSWIAGSNGAREPFRYRIFRVGWPAADLVIALDAPGKLLYQRKHEHSPEWLENRRREYLQLKERLPDMKSVDAARPRDEVLGDVLALIWKNYAATER